MNVFTPEVGVPIHVWGRTIPPGALAQLKMLAAQPWAVEHVAAMPDLHVANGVAVGSVFATERTVVPVALGGDLGCGMSAIRFPFPAAALSRVDLQRLLARLGSAIPVGDAVHRGRRARELERSLATHALDRACERLVPRHLGTLGGGNHFVELDRDGGGDLWLLIHSGSRGVGSAIAAHHLRVAQSEGHGEIPGLSLDTPTGQVCLRDIEWAIDFARANRQAILSAAAEVIFDATQSEASESLDVHHNFVREEVHFGRPLLVHRKGAIAAPAGERALIPGSMGTASYVVEGRGEASSYSSASHGAGRVLTRKQAHQEISPDQLIHSMRRVVFEVGRARALLEEAPAVYRDIGEVLEDEQDLVTPLVRLEPVAVLKG
jgi:tRNA-splicing ligase RtcB (3'-phosphate/5'-hydroxy nucleic acid ligase)